MSQSLLQRTLTLQSSEMFANLDTDDLVPFASLCSEVTLADGQCLFRTGELGDAMYIVTHGQVAIERERRLIAELGAGECVGEMAALDWEPRSADVIARGSVSLLRIDRNDLLDLVADYPELIGGLVRVLTARMRQGGNSSA